MHSVAQEVESVTDQRVRDRFAALSVLWKMSTLDRQRTCQRISVREDGTADIVAGGSGDERTSGWSGLASCGSVWTCPCCSEKILSGRQVEMQEALEAWERLGHGKVAMVTLTMRHDKSQSLESLWDGLSYAWGKVTSGRGWERAHNDYGAMMPRKVTRGARAGRWEIQSRIGYARLVEVTNGKNGWHVHIHCALFVNSSMTGQDVDDLGCEMFQRWADALERKGFRAPMARSGGLDAQLWDGSTKKLSRYFTKQSYLSTADRAAMELTRGDLKKARNGNRSPMEILTALAEKSPADRAEALDDLRAWFEWERVSAGRRQITWSTGLRNFLNLAPEASDDELANEKQEGLPLVRLDRGALKMVARKELNADCKILARVDDDGATLEGFLTSHGVLFRRSTAEEKWDYQQGIVWAKLRAEERRQKRGNLIPKMLLWACTYEIPELTLF